MARPSQRWVFLLCVCLLLQQFAPAYTAHINIHAVTKRSDEDEVGQKRGGLWNTIKLLGGLGGKALTGITRFANFVTFSATLVQTIHGCNITEPEIPRLFKDVCDMKDEYYGIQKNIEDISWKAVQLQVQADHAFEGYKRTSEILRDFDEEVKRVKLLITIEPKLILQGFEHNLTQYFEKLNASGEAVDAAEVVTKFSNDLDNALTLGFTGVSLAAPAFKKIWQKHLKSTYVGKQISKIAEKLKIKFLKPVSNNAQKAMKKITSSGLLGRAQEFIRTKLQNLAKRAGTKFTKAKNLMGKAKSGLKGLAKLGGTVMAVWLAWTQLTKCKDNLEAGRQSKEAMQVELNKIKGYQTEMNNAYEQIKEAWMDIWNVTTDGCLIEVMNLMKGMVLDPDFLKDEDERQVLGKNIDNYLKVANLDPKEKSTVETFVDAQADLNSNMGIIKITLGCQNKKVNMFKNVVRDCARGNSPLPYIYKNNVDMYKLQFDPIEKCKDRTGAQYITEELMKKGWEGWVKSNGTSYNKICLMNDQQNVDNVKDKLREKETDPEIVVKILRDDEREYGMAEIEQMIKLLQEEFPNIDKELNRKYWRSVCNWKKEKSPEKVLEQLQTLMDAFGEGDKATMDQINNVDCSEFE